MKLSKSEIGVMGLVVASFALAFYVYPYLPEKVASHWNAAGEVNGYITKFWGAFLMPFLSVFIFVLFLVVPRIDPKSRNIEKFRGYFDAFILLFFLFLLYLDLLTLAWNFGWRFNMVQMLAPAFGALFFYIGVMVAHAECNWSIGIRTPWTLSSDKVWEKTHRLGGVMFKVSGILALLGIVFPSAAIWLMLGPVVITALVTIVYSYVVYGKVSR